MKKRIILIGIFLVTGMIAGCSSRENEPEVKNSSSDLNSGYIIQEDSNNGSEQRNIDNDINENTSNEYIGQEDSNNDSEQRNMNNDVNGNISNEYAGQENNNDVSEQYSMNDDIVSNENAEEIIIDDSFDIIDIEQIEKEGGKVEFAGVMTYGDFQALGWTDDIDVRLDKEEKVYIVKVYYPEGFDHYKVGKIENCEAIGIYSIEDGTYLGGSFMEKK